MNDVIQLEQGTYGVTGNWDSAFSYSSNQTYSLVIWGGYTSGCASRVPDPLNTILDGEGISNVLIINDSGLLSYPRWSVVEDITVQDSY